MAETARQAFFRSPHHAALAAGTIGVGIMTGEPIGLIAGFVGYVLGWVYLPDTGFFSRWREGRKTAEIESERRAELGEFAARRDALIAGLTESRRVRNADFAGICRQIATGQDPRARKLEEMQWTYLRLLGMQQALEIFLEGERRDGVPVLLGEAEDEIAALELEMEKARAGGVQIPEAREKFYESRRSRFEVLQQRAHRIVEAQDNARLATAELERLEEQTKLIRADGVATKNAGSLSDRIDATFSNLAQTNRWLSEMDAFRDQLGDLPEGGMGVRSPFAAPARREWQRRQEGETGK